MNWSYIILFHWPESSKRVLHPDSRRHISDCTRSECLLLLQVYGMFETDDSLMLLSIGTAMSPCFISNYINLL